MNKTKSPRSIVFDFGGVLIDWNPVYLYQNVFKEEADMLHFLENICHPDWNIMQGAGRPLDGGHAAVAGRSILIFMMRLLYSTGDGEEDAGRYDRREREAGEATERKIQRVRTHQLVGRDLADAKERYDFFDDLDGIVVSGRKVN